MIVACVWVKGNVPYTADYVLKLRSMVRRHIGIEEKDGGNWRFVCLTDRPEQLPGIETRTIPSPQGWPGWWSKLELFNPAHFPHGEGVLYLDLDVLVMDRLWLAAMHCVGSTLTLIPHEGSFQTVGSRRVVKRYNSSVMGFHVGAHSDLYLDWRPEHTRQYWGDQDWIGERLPNQLTFPLEWFPRISAIGADPAKAAKARVVLCKRPKNHEAAALWPWVAEVWK